MRPGPVLIVPAAGLGTRLHAGVPKALYQLSGKPLIAHLFDLYASVVSEFVLVLHPAAEEAVRKYCDGCGVRIRYARQEQPTGMLDAILAPMPELRDGGAGRIWITWCDQIGIHPLTVRTLAQLDRRQPSADVIMPTARRRDPYIHLDRGSDGRIVRILHRREGDRMPDVGESDMGMFSLGRAAYFERLPEFARENRNGPATGERSFLPFIPWMAERGQVQTFACQDPREAIGVNDAADVASVERYLAERRAQSGA
jgi:bifunctional UDP-N-acetylglucosamine pyrophosphorylase / glucosamine-1-phosphate N-acetyltransferase